MVSYTCEKQGYRLPKIRFENLNTQSSNPGPAPGPRDHQNVGRHVSCYHISLTIASESRAMANNSGNSDARRISNAPYDISIFRNPSPKKIWIEHNQISHVPHLIIKRSPWWTLGDWTKMSLWALISPQSTDAFQSKVCIVCQPDSW